MLFLQTEHLSWESAFFQATSHLDLFLSGTESGQKWLLTHKEQCQGRKRRCAWGPIPTAPWRTVWQAESPSEGLVHTSTNRVPVFRDLRSRGQPSLQCRSSDCVWRELYELLSQWPGIWVNQKGFLEFILVKVQSFSIRTTTSHEAAQHYETGT